MIKKDKRIHFTTVYTATPLFGNHTSWYLTRAEVAVYRYFHSSPAKIMRIFEPSEREWSEELK